tara:strand:- start:471 stop:635 length:165 start_codon:yes stop_codon:yes gene_type:complete
MGTSIVKAEGFKTFQAAADAFQVATNSLTFNAKEIGGVVKIGSANWGYWILHSL